MSLIYYLVGVTRVGKTTVIDTLTAKYPHIFGAVEVGKVFRERYPPSHFEGQGAPEHTEQESVDIFYEELAKVKDKTIILVSGQPRRMSQIKLVVDNPGVVIWLHENEQVLFDRALNIEDAGARDLSLRRITDDKQKLFDIIHTLMFERIPLRCTHSQEMIDFLSEIIDKKGIK